MMYFRDLFTFNQILFFFIGETDKEEGEGTSCQHQDEIPVPSEVVDNEADADVCQESCSEECKPRHIEKVCQQSVPGNGLLAHLLFFACTHPQTASPFRNLTFIKARKSIPAKQRKKKHFEISLVKLCFKTYSALTNFYLFHY